jgi:hypothetical protein
MKDGLHLARGLTLPVEMVTQTAAILAKRGAGKTHTAVVLTEELLAAGQQVVILDPLDVWFGLRSSIDGKTPGFPITVLGGEHGDLPLEASSGAIVADFVVENRAPIILSMRHFSMADQRRLVTDFCERLYHRKGQDRYRQPLQVVIDEADEFVPQRIQAGQERMFGSVDRLVRRGRASGIGVTLISQRAAVVNKDVLTQIEVLICLRTISPQDRKALEAWVEAHDAHDQRQEFMDSLASLGIGEAWVWSPGWLDLFKRVQIRERKTFDSSATPKVGERPLAPTASAAVDLEKLRKDLAATIERAKVEDPRELRKRIACLDAELRKRGGPVDPAALQRAREEGRAAGAAEEKKIMGPGLLLLRGRLVDISKEVNLALQALDQVLGAEQKPAAAVRVTPQIVPRRSVSRPVVVDGRVSGGERKILTALAQYPQGRTKRQIAILTAYAVTGGAFQNYLGALRSKGCIEGRDLLSITEAGLAALGAYDPLPSGRELLEHWLRQLGKAERLILSRLAEIYPTAATKEDLGAATGYEPSGGGFQNALGRLRTLELVEGRAELKASEELFN